MHLPRTATTTATAMTLSLLAAVLAGCSAQTPAAPQVPKASAPVAVSPGAAKQSPGNPAPATSDSSDCVMPQENWQIGTYLSVFNGENDPDAIKMAPGFTLPIRQAHSTYTMYVILSGQPQNFRVVVDSDTWQFMPNSGALRPNPDLALYEFAVEPKDGTPKPGTIKITFANLPAGMTVAPMILRVFGPNDKLPSCDVPTAYPAPSARPKK